MNENQRKLRRTAAREFIQSLSQLEAMLKSATASEENRVKTSPAMSPGNPPAQPEEMGLNSLAADETLDEVAADIDRYIEENKSEEL